MRIRPLPVVLVAAFTGAIACTNDFDVFEGPFDADGGATSSSSTSSSSSSSGGSSSSSSSGATGDDGGDPPLPPVDCSTSASCFAQEETCNGECAATHTTCTDMCDNGGPGRACRKTCDDAQTGCLGQCKTTCEQCAGPPCRDGCP